MKKIRLVLIILASAGILCFMGFILNRIAIHSGKNNLMDFSIKDVSFSAHPDDSIYFTEAVKSDLVVQYTSKSKHYQYISVYRYKGKYNLIVRKLSDNPSDLKSLFKVQAAKNTADLFVSYSMQGNPPFTYKIDVQRIHDANTNLTINGDHIEVLKHTKDSLLIHGNILDLAIGKKGSYVNEVLYMEDDLLPKRSINTELLIFNRDNKLYFYILFPDSQQTVPKGILNEIR